MSEPKIPDQRPTDGAPKKLVFTARRAVLWIVVGAVGMYLIIEGIIGMITKAR